MSLKKTDVDEPATPPIEPPPISPPPGQAAKAVGEPFIFHGRAGEYFRIWVTNILLTIVTLGIFAAWAKVRRRRYLRGNLELLGHRFDYTARPARLLVGNLVVLSFFLAYALFGAVYAGVKIAAVVAAVCLLPWVVVRSLSFNAHNTSYCGTRFRFHPSLSAATLTYLLEFLVVIVTLGIYYPAWSLAKRRFLVERHRFGTGYFQFNTKAGSYYAAYVPAGIAIVAALGIGAVCFSVLRRQVPLQTLSVIITFGVYLPTVLLARQFVYVRVFNAAWNGTRLDDSYCEANMSLGEWLKLQIGNWGAILGTLGFLYPWAVMRNARYTASCLRFYPSADFYRIQKFGGAGGAAIGDTAAEFMGLDFGL